MMFMHEYRTKFTELILDKELKQYQKSFNVSSDGYDYKFFFPNGFGASVIKIIGSYGYRENKFELAVTDNEGNLEYGTHITDDVIGNLTDSEVNKLLYEIKNLCNYDEYDWEERINISMSMCFRNKLDEKMLSCNSCPHIECIDRYKEVSQYCEGEKKDYRTPEEWEELTIKGLERAYYER